MIGCSRGELISTVERFNSKEKLEKRISNEMYITSFFDKDSGQFDIIAIQVMMPNAVGWIRTRTIQKTFIFKDGRWIGPEKSELIDFED
jgi:hypothetical protein